MAGHYRFTRRPVITVRDFRSHMREVIKAGEPRIIGNPYLARCIILPVSPTEWRRKKGMDLRLTETRKRFEEVMATLER